MKFTRLSASAIAFVWLAAGAANAQTIDWRSDTNRTFWNGITMGELRELAGEAGAQFIDLPDSGRELKAQLVWPDLKPVIVTLADCNGVAGASPNCGELRLHISDLKAPTDYEAYNLVSSSWTSTAISSGKAAIYRSEILTYGTTRGHVLGSLMLFRREAIAELVLLDQFTDD
ncbi:hypothetical protein [uncultured Brevundimonas sp.]|uniref:hypothetical protein n=1 Tax=uncultured Brevundimonas sp. TaxID=213418 RepID=UPI0030EE5B59|tara:strand:+ start:4651 stop:5169 length:519 start_codon:yes stop_codon:yes gene_type:complete